MFGLNDQFVVDENLPPNAQEYALPPTDDEDEDEEEPTDPTPRPVFRPVSLPAHLPPSSPFDSEFSFASIATGRLHDRHLFSSPPTGVIRISKRSSYILDEHSATSLRHHLGSSPPATPPLSLCGTDSDIDGWTEVDTPEPSSRRRSLINRPGSSDSNVSSASVMIEETDPDFIDMDLNILPPSSTIPVDKQGSRELTRYDRTSPSPPRSLTSLAHRTTRAIFTKTIDLAIHKPSNFLTAFMLNIASRLVRGAVVYSYYWGDWKNGDVRGKGAVSEEYSSSEEEEEEEEDDFGVKILGRKRRKSAPDLTMVS
ncbi:hypothetical protein ABW19_dt0200311 [Dactylella cylindrospora]|nr:hypothetical protein ABW19_dt0200311 [Dactylella cylindrospora]